MSVKDKITMWNSMANNPPVPAPQNNKLAASDTAPKSKQHEKEKKGVANPSVHSADGPKAPPAVGMALSFKKTESADHQAAVTVEQAVKAPTLAEKPKEAVEPSETAGVGKKEAQVGKFNDIKKQLQQQTAGKGIYFAPQPPKKVETAPANSRGVECQIEKEVPKFSVKEQAAKLAQFFLQKSQNELKKQEERQEESQEEKPHIPQEEHPKEQQNRENVSHAKQQAKNCLNISINQNLPPHSAPPEKGEAQKKTVEDGSGVDRKLRVAKNKKKREQFSSDED